VDTHSIPAATLTLGLPGKLEFAVDGSLLKSEVPAASDLGFGDLGLGFKWRFWSRTAPFRSCGGLCAASSGR
jgi:hypothetical protein